MSQSQIKWLAAVLMLIDHIGFMIEAEQMRMVGRLSFPLFCWVFAENWKRPGDKNPLITRLILFGVLSQIPHILLFGNLQLNIMFSFAVAALTFSYIRRFKHKILVLIIGLVSAQVLGIEYSWYAIACPLLMSNFKKRKSKKIWWGCWITINLIYAICSQSLIQIVAILAPLRINYHQPEKDRQPTALEKKFFYYFYPIHLAGLAALRAIV